MARTTPTYWTHYIQRNWTQFGPTTKASTSMTFWSFTSEGSMMPKRYSNLQYCTLKTPSFWGETNWPTCSGWRRVSSFSNVCQVAIEFSRFRFVWGSTRTRGLRWTVARWRRSLLFDWRTLAAERSSWWITTWTGTLLRGEWPLILPKTYDFIEGVIFKR